jgi:hypothetical protein
LLLERVLLEILDFQLAVLDGYVLLNATKDGNLLLRGETLCLANSLPAWR